MNGNMPKPDYCRRGHLPATPLLQLILLMLFGSILFVNSGYPQQANEAPQEVRGLWVVRHTLKDSLAIARMLQDANRIRVTDLFVQVRGRGDAFYNSKFINKPEGVAANFDPLAYLLKQPLAKQFRIHLWINVYYLWSAEQLPTDSMHLVYQKPEWLVYPANYPDSTSLRIDYLARRNIEGLYLSPHIPEVSQYLIAVADELLETYPVAGLHLDYVRFADHQYDFHPAARAAFREKYFIDPTEFKRNPQQFVADFGQTGYEIFYSRWGQFQRDAVSGFVRRLSEHIRQKFPGKFISAAVKPEIQKAHWQFYQEWDKWLQKDWLDFAVPMNYTPGRTLFNRRINHILRVADRPRVLMGIGLYNQSAGGAMDKIQVTRDYQLPGFVLFSYDTIFQNAGLRKLLMR